MAAAAQIEPVSADIQANIAAHLRFIDAAASQGADLVVFPDLSLTGYEPEPGPRLQLEPSDPRIDRLRYASKHHGLSIVIGAPWNAGHDKPYIGAFIVSPRQVQCYAKIHVSENESRYFSAGTEICVISVNGVQTGLSICADTSFASHAASTAEHGARLYAASVMKDEEEYRAHLEHMGRYCNQHNMAALSANYTGSSGEIECAGKSAVWDASGNIVAEARQSEQAIVIGRYAPSKWTGTVLATWSQDGLRVVRLGCLNDGRRIVSRHDQRTGRPEAQ